MKKQAKEKVAALLIVAALLTLSALPVAAQAGLPTADTIDMSWVSDGVYGGFWLAGLFGVVMGVIVTFVIGLAVVKMIPAEIAKYLR